MLIWFQVLIMILCGFLGICILCKVHVKCGSYSYVVKLSSKEHKMSMIHFNVLLA